MAKAIAIYTLGRLLIVAVLAALLVVIGLAQFPAVILALLLSVPASYFLLATPRQKMVAAVEARRIERADIRSRLAGDED